jgi:hypothetical protein
MKARHHATHRFPAVHLTPNSKEKMLQANLEAISQSLDVGQKDTKQHNALRQYGKPS